MYIVYWCRPDVSDLYSSGVFEHTTTIAYVLVFVGLGEERRVHINENTLEEGVALRARRLLVGASYMSVTSRCPPIEVEGHGAIRLGNSRNISNV